MKLKVGNEVEDLKIYNYDDQGNEYIRKISGEIIQVTDKFIVVDNGKFCESFKFSELEKGNKNLDSEEPYDLSVESYSNDIVQNALEDIKKGKEGYVFNFHQVGEVINKLKPAQCSYREENSIFYIKVV